MPIPAILLALGKMFINKKRIVGWLSAVALAVGAVVAGMNSAEFKEAVCSATPIELNSPQETSK